MLPDAGVNERGFWIDQRSEDKTRMDMKLGVINSKHENDPC